MFSNLYSKKSKFFKYLKKSRVKEAKIAKNMLRIRK